MIYERHQIARDLWIYKRQAAGCAQRWSGRCCGRAPSPARGMGRLRANRAPPTGVDDRWFLAGAHYNTATRQSAVTPTPLRDRKGYGAEFRDIGHLTHGGCVRSRLELAAFRLRVLGGLQRGLHSELFDFVAKLSSRSNFARSLQPLQISRQCPVTESKSTLPGLMLRLTTRSALLSEPPSRRSLSR